MDSKSRREFQAGEVGRLSASNMRPSKESPSFLAAAKGFNPRAELGQGCSALLRLCSSNTDGLQSAALLH